MTPAHKENKYQYIKNNSIEKKNYNNINKLKIYSI